MLLQHEASVKYGYSTPLGEYRVFFNESFPLQSAVDGAVRVERQPQFMQFPLDGRNTDLRKWRRFQATPGGDNKFFLAVSSPDGLVSGARECSLYQSSVPD